MDERTLFNYSNYISSRYSKEFETARKNQFKVSLKNWFFMKLSSTSLSLIAIIIGFSLINPVLLGYISIGTFMAINVAVFTMVGAIGWSLQDATENISKSSEYMHDLTEFINLSRIDGALDLPDNESIEFGSIEFKNVYFKYPNADKFILNNLSFSLVAGKNYAFVGINGAGKTTIIKLLTGLYDDYEGEIFINNIELRNYHLSSIKSLFSVIYQDFARYQISIEDNIKLGVVSTEVKDIKINDILDKLDMNLLIDSFDNGLKTNLGKINNDGVDISGGQWQKIAIARSLISPAPVKILDEPTAALDPIAESKLYSEFENLMNDKTTILISHRLGSIKLVDEILVIKDGKIIEKGSHKDLIDLNGEYYEMFESQRKWYE